MPAAQDWVEAVRQSHERLRGLLAPLSAEEVSAPSYAADWSIAAVASHLGSQAEIFGLLLEAAHDHSAPPGREQITPIWERWDALEPTEQVRRSIEANEAFVVAVEGLPTREREAFAVSAFGLELDLVGLLAMRLSEHAVHTWDVAVTLDPVATLAPDAVDLLVDRLPGTVGRAGRPAGGARVLSLATTAPARSFVLTVGEGVSLEPTPEAGEDPVRLPAEALLRLVYGRLDPAHTPDGVEESRVAGLRPVFPGF